MLLKCNGGTHGSSSTTTSSDMLGSNYLHERGQQTIYQNIKNQHFNSSHTKKTECIFNLFLCLEIKDEFHSHTNPDSRYNWGCLSSFLYFNLCLAVISIVVCLLDILPLYLIDCNVLFKPLRFLSLGQMVCISLLFFSFQCFYHLCKQLKQKPTKKTLATCCEIGAIVEFEMIPPWALQAEAQGFKQLQA